MLDLIGDYGWALNFVLKLWGLLKKGKYNILFFNLEKNYDKKKLFIYIFRDAIVTHDLDITCRPEQSNPVNMPGSGYLAHQTNVSCLWFDENYLQDSGNGNNFVLFFYLMKIRENDFFFFRFWLNVDLPAVLNYLQDLLIILSVIVLAILRTKWIKIWKMRSKKLWLKLFRLKII